MDKKLATIGAILFVMGLVFVLGSSQSAVSGLPNANNTVTQSAYVPPNSVAYYPIQLINSSFVAIDYNANVPVDFYLVNSSAYNAMQPYIAKNESLHNISVSLEGKGVIAIAWQSENGIYPYQSSYSTLFNPPNYTIQNVTVLPTGTYYMLFQSGRANTTLLGYSLLVTPESNLGLSSYASAGFGVIGGLLVLVGFSLVVFAVLKRGPAPETTKDKQAEMIFAELEKKQKVVKKAKKNKHKKAVRRKL